MKEFEGRRWEITEERKIYNEKEKNKDLHYYTPNYIPFLKTFIQTYNGQGDLWLQPTESMTRETATFSKPWQFKKCINQDVYDYYIFLILIYCFIQILFY